MNIPRFFEPIGISPKFASRSTHSHADSRVPARPPAVALILAAYTKYHGRYGANSPLIPRSSRVSFLSNAVQINATIDRLEPLYRRIHQRLLQGPYLQMEELQLPIRGGPQWLRVVGLPADDVVYDSQTLRRPGQPTALLDGFSGYLHVRDDGRRNAFAQRNPKLIQVGCWADTRTRFLKAHADWPKAVDLILRIIDWLGAREAQADAQSLSARERLCLRQQTRRPLFWLNRITCGLRRKLPAESPLRAACNHLVRSWALLTRHYETGETQLEHTLAEEVVSLDTVGTARGLPRGDRAADRRAAIVYSLVVSCLRRGIEPASYLQDVLFRLPEHSTEAGIDTLTPSRWRAERHREHRTSNAQLPTSNMNLE